MIKRIAEFAERQTTILLLGILVPLCCHSVVAQDNAHESATWMYDHHVHVLSPALIADWKSTGMQFSRPDEAYSDVETFLADNHVRGAFLVSMAHLYTTERFSQLESVAGNEQQLVARENDFVANRVAVDPQHLIGFYSVNPLRDYAMVELNRCHKVPGLTGLKLHLPACDVSIANDEHLEKLKDIFSWAEAHHVPILLHLFTEDDVDASLANRFWEQLVQPHPKLELYLAHLGAAGGYNDASQSILRGFVTLCDLAPEFKSSVFFDLSGAVIVEEIEGIPPTSPENCLALGKQMKRIGIDRFLFASDYPVFTVESVKSALTEKLGLAEADLHQLLTQKSPQFETKGVRPRGAAESIK